MSTQYPHNPQQPFQPVPPAPPKKKYTVRNIVIGAAVGFVVLVGGCTAIVGSALSDVDTSTDKPVTVVSPVDNGPTPDPITTPTNKPPVAKTTQPPTPKATQRTTEPPAKPKVTKPAMTASQEQAVGTAEDYLQTQSFSRKGLIEQLKFEGFSTKDATFGVDHLKVDWNDQAVGVAKGYLNGQHFSRAGLIEQLEYEGFTHKQAVYGVKGAGL